MATSRPTSRCRSRRRKRKIRVKSPLRSSTAMRAHRRVLVSCSKTVEVAGPGFINLRLAAGCAAASGARRACSRRTGSASATHTQVSSVMVEFVSANPTGPLHLGHARQAALGDALANLLAAQGWRVTREFYYNDAGVQIANAGAVSSGARKGAARRARRFSRKRIPRRIHCRDRA